MELRHFPDGRGVAIPADSAADRRTTAAAAAPHQHETPMLMLFKSKRRASEWLTTALRRRDVPDPEVECLELALHEVLTNVLAHGGSAARRADPHPHRSPREGHDR
jgi:hypothetical protein